MNLVVNLLIKFVLVFNIKLKLIFKCGNIIRLLW